MTRLAVLRRPLGRLLALVAVACFFVASLGTVPGVQLSWGTLGMAFLAGWAATR